MLKKRLEVKNLGNVVNIVAIHNNLDLRAIAMSATSEALSQLSPNTCSKLNICIYIYISYIYI